MKVVKDHWVNLTYQLFDSQQNALEEPDQTVRYLHGGYGVLFPKLEQALDGKTIGDKVVVYLEPFDHFGEYDAQKVYIHKLTEFEDAGMALAEGDVFDGRPGVPDDGGEYRVLHLAQGSVVLDGNHPYAEMSLCYHIEITAIELAAEQDIAMQAAAKAFAEQVDDDEDFGEDSDSIRKLH